MSSNEPEWMRCTVEQWEKKAELSLQSGKMSDALKYADLANCREMYDNGVDQEKIEQRLGIDA